MFKSILNKKKIITQENILEILAVIAFVLIGISVRLLPHLPNFTPVAAIALFGGFYFRNKKVAFILPVIVMLVSDMFIGYYQISLMAVVYGSFLLCVILGSKLIKHEEWYTILGSSLLAAIIFFLLTNFAVWFTTSWYPKSISGILQCYLMGLPFFRNTLLGNVFYVSCFFGIYKLVGFLVGKKLEVYKKGLVLTGYYKND